MTTGVDELGSYVMSALTATMMGGTMSVTEVHVRLMNNGWAVVGQAEEVAAKLEEMVAAGSVQRSAGGYAMAEATIASILRQAGCDEAGAE